MQAGRYSCPAYATTTAALRYCVKSSAIELYENPSSAAVLSCSLLTDGPTDCTLCKTAIVPKMHRNTKLLLTTDYNLKKLSLIIFLGSKVRPVFRTDNLTTICEPIV
jgi:hypothetical protein